MDPFYFERKKEEFFAFHSNNKSAKNVTLYLAEFYEELFSEADKILIDAYINETIVYFLSSISNFSAFGVEPERTIELLETAYELKRLCINEDHRLKLNNNIERIHNELILLEEFLKGKSLNSFETTLSFPAIERSSSESGTYGSIERLQVSVHANRKSDHTEFMIFPSLPTLDVRLETQIKISWNFALKYLKSNYKIGSPNLIVTIKFVNKMGIYEGDSLGVALTIGFIQELYHYFDLRNEIIIDRQVSATGPVNADGSIRELNEKIIKSKIHTVFFSVVDLFVVPFNDFTFAKEVMADLKSKYPGRKLDLVGASNITDVLNRRDVLSVAKQNYVKWGAKKIIKHKLILGLIILFILTLSAIYLYSQDKNPHHIEHTSNSYLIKNQYDEILWSKKTNKDLNKLDQILLERDYRIVDYNSDETNEVLLVNGNKDALCLYDQYGETIWAYKFGFDGLKKGEEEFANNFPSPFISGIEEINHRETIIGFSQQMPYYPTAIIQIDLESGKRVGDILWHNGGVIAAKTADIDKDGRKEIIVSAINNELGRGVIFSIDLDKLKGQAPEGKLKTSQILNIAEFNTYILLPKPDYFAYYFSKYYTPVGFNVDTEKNKITTAMVKHGELKSVPLAVNFIFNLNFEPTGIVFKDRYIHERDKLVLNGELQLPFTDTDEYRRILLNQIEYWDGEKFEKFTAVPRE